MAEGNAYIGKLTKDAEYRTIEKLDNKPVLKVSTFLGGKKPNAEYMTVSLWDADADTYNGLKEGDVVLFGGIPEEREYNGKIYKEIKSPTYFRPLAGHKPTPVKKPTAPPVDEMPAEDLPF